MQFKNWGLIMLDRDGFRPNVGIILLNQRNQVFWGKRIRTHSWQFPQGGIDRGESPEQAMFRELHEEVGLHPEHVRIMARTRDWLRYEVPDRFIRRDARVLRPGGDGGRPRQARDEHRAEPRDGRPVAELPLRVAPPALHRAAAHERARMTVAHGDLERQPALSTVSVEDLGDDGGEPLLGRLPVERAVRVQRAFAASLVDTPSCRSHEPITPAPFVERHVVASG